MGGEETVVAATIVVDDINEDTYRTTFTISEDEEDPEGLEILDSDE